MIINYFKKSIDVRKGEGKKTLLMFFYLFLTIASLLIVKPIRNSLIISESGVDKLPYAFILVAITSAIFTIFYTRLTRRYKLYSLIKLNLFLSITIVLISRLVLFFDLHIEIYSYFFYVWVAVFGLITTMQFWLLANYLFHARQAKRLFSILAAGGIAGGIFGGYLTRYLAHHIGTDNLLFVCVLFLLICVFIIQSISQTIRQTADEHGSKKPKSKLKEERQNPFKLIFNSTYLLLIALLIGISVIVANLVDFQFNEIASRKFSNPDELTAFFGFWLSNLSVISLIIQMFFTSRILRSIGVGASLYFLPVGIFVGAIAVLFSPVLWAAILIKVNEGCTKQSINKSGLELLSIPIPDKVKEQTKVVLDVFTDNLATGIGGILLIVLTSFFHLGTKYISILIIAFILLWLFIIFLLKKEYIDAFKKAIETRSIDLENLSIDLRDANIYDSLLTSLSSKNDRQIIYVLNLFEEIPNKKFIPQLLELLDHPSAEIQARVLSITLSENSVVVPENLLNKMMIDGSEDVRLNAMLHYLRQNENSRIEILKNFIYGDNFTVSQTAVLCVAMLSIKNKDILNQINLKDIFDNYRKLRQNYEYSDEEQLLMRINAAKIIGILKNEEFNPLLNLLIDDEDLNVRREAIKSAGNVGDPYFIQHIFNHTNTKRIRRASIESLAKFGNDTVKYFAEILDEKTLAPGLKLIIPRILSRIPTQSSVELLFICLKKEDRLLQYNVIQSLVKLESNYPHLDYHFKEIDSIVKNMISVYFLINHSIIIINKHITLSSKTISSRTAYELLLKILIERKISDLGRIFKLLSIRYESSPIDDAYNGIVSQNSELKENAIEYLENILTKNKDDLILLLDNPRIELYQDKSLEYFGVSSEINSVYQGLLNCDDGLIKACILFIMQQNQKIPYSVIASHIKSENPVLRDTAEIIYKAIE